MVSYRKLGGVLFAGSLSLACGGSSSTDLLNGGADSGADGSASDTGSSSNGDATTADSGMGKIDAAGAGGDSAQPTEGGDDATANGDATASDDGPPTVPGDSASDAPNAPCPDVSGAYSVSIVQAAGCGDLNPTARQCIQQNPQGCSIMFVSQGLANVSAINGDPTLQNDGSFDSGALKEGSVNRTGCTGSWDAATSTMTVDCGGSGSSQSCVVALTRTGARCP
jgi:hypothetical protein